MEYLWNLYGISMEYLWNISGISLEYLRNVYGIWWFSNAMTQEPMDGGYLPFFKPIFGSPHKLWPTRPEICFGPEIPSLGANEPRSNVMNIDEK